jgi:hypothetical protein
VNEAKQHGWAAGSKSGVLARAALRTGFLLLFSASGACQDRSAAPLKTQAAAPLAAPPARSARSYMLSHYADTQSMRKGLIAGRLDDFHSAAAAVARDPWSPRSNGDYGAYLDRVRSAASSAEAAPSLAAGAAALGSLGEACAACHRQSGGPETPVAPEDPSERANPKMFAHAVAAERAWAGLILPSDESWMSGMQLLVAAPSGDEKPDREASRHLRDLGRRGQIAANDQRGKIFGEVLTTCSECHQREGQERTAGDR